MPKNDREPDLPKKLFRRLFGVRSVVVGLAAGAGALFLEAAAVTDALKAAVTPLAVVQGIVLISVMRPLGGDPDDEHGTVRGVALWCVFLSTWAVGLILAHIAAPAGAVRSSVGAFAALVTALALTSLLRIHDLRELVREVRDETPSD